MTVFDEIAEKTDDDQWVLKSAGTESASVIWEPNLSLGDAGLAKSSGKTSYILPFDPASLNAKADSLTVTSW
ncbi:hypothetical protein V502_01667, partial [Pseudogymnoascus sp. VKM F-4520 (FW-2644)]